MGAVQEPEAQRDLLAHKASYRSGTFSEETRRDEGLFDEVSPQQGPYPLHDIGREGLYELLCRERQQSPGKAISPCGKADPISGSQS